jgi:hypothetical protein
MIGEPSSKANAYVLVVMALTTSQKHAPVRDSARFVTTSSYCNAC